MTLMSVIIGLAAAAAAAVLVPKLVKDQLEKKAQPQPIPVPVRKD